MATLNLEGIFPFITTAVSFLFFLSVSEQYLRKRKLHQLVWALSMLLFMVTAGAEGLSLLLGTWDPFIYRIYYLFAAVQVAVMGAGALYLFASRQIINEANAGKALVLFGFIWTFFAFIFQFRASIFLVVLVPALLITLAGFYLLFSTRTKGFENTFHITGFQFTNIFVVFVLYIFVFMVYTAMTAELDLAYLAASEGQEVAGHGWVNDLPDLRATVRLFSPLYTIPGSVALIGGAFFSYYMWQRAIKKQTGSYDLGKGFFNIYIGVGALALAIAGTLSGFGFGVLYLGEAVSVIIMYFGFLESDKITWQKLIYILTLGWLRNPEPSEASIGSE
ncbi:MAG: hypothetical protein ACXACP_05230 [Candidatus Hodarchaeales archaeon]|jgi:hypothetical protein